MKDFNTKDLAVVCQALTLALSKYMAVDPNDERAGRMAGLLSNACGLLTRAQTIGLLEPPGKQVDFSWLEVPGIY